MYARAPEGRPRLLGEALQTLVVEPEIGLAWVTVPPGAVERFGLGGLDLELSLRQYSKKEDGT